MFCVGELYTKTCSVCKYKLLKDGWCSFCDMANFVQPRDLEDGSVKIPVELLGEDGDEDDFFAAGVLVYL